MADDIVRATTIIDAPAAVIFAVLADPAQHAAIDGTGWVWTPSASTSGSRRSRRTISATRSPTSPNS